ncbi:hypothetical protein [Nocardioides sp. KR10-350]|uniref:anti-sigma factor family protein n=1 Tax=Nocardioides cheoyonin TaxID=3156615 RepID=UPI0032B56E7E
MSLLGGHLGARASALLDGQLPEDEAERAWAHVEDCAVCRGQLEREQWLKRRLAGLGCAPDVAAPDRLKGELLGAPRVTTEQLLLGFAQERRSTRRTLAFAAFGGGAVGAAMLGLLAVGAGPAAAPTFHRHTPVTTIDPTVPTVAVVHNARRPGR